METGRLRSSAARAVCAAAVFFGASSFAAQSAKVELSEVLDKAEPYAPLLVHAGFLWTGHSRKDGLIDYSVERRSLEGKLLSSVRIPHSVTTIHAYGPDKVLVMGKSYVNEWKTHYTVVSNDRRGQLRGSTYTFSTKWMADEYAGTPSNMFFTEPGSRAVLSMGTLGVSPLKFEVSGPGVMTLVGNSLFILERKGFSYGDENLVRYDTKTKKATRAFPTNRAGLASLLALQGGKEIVLSEAQAGQVVFVDTATNKEVGTVAIPAGSPRMLAQWGSCLVVATHDAEKKTLTYVDVKERKVVEEREITDAPKEFSSLYAMTVDPVSGRVYGRSSAPCLLCGESSNAFVTVEAPSADLRKTCGLAK